MKKGDLVVDKCENPKHTNGIGIIIGECYTASKEKWYNVYYFNTNTVKTELVDNIRIISNETRPHRDNSERHRKID